MQRLEETEDVILRRENKNSDKDGKGNGNVESEDRKRGDLQPGKRRQTVPLGVNQKRRVGNSQTGHGM